MEQAINRIEQAMLSWKVKEEKFRKLFPESERTVLKETIKQYRQIAVKYRNTATEEERSSLRILHADISRIERKVEPRRLVALLYKFLIAPIRKALEIREAKQGELNDAHTIQQTVTQLGIADLNASQIKAISVGVKDVVNLAYNFSASERVDYQMNFGLSAGGERQLNSLTISRIDRERKINESQTFTYNKDYCISAMEAYHLICGRAVCKEQLNNTGTRTEKWIQLDFTDKDAVGNYRLRTFTEASLFDIQSCLKQLPFKNESMVNVDTIADLMKAGVAVPINLSIGGKDVALTVEAHPTSRYMRFRDADKKEVALSELMNPTRQQHVKRNGQKQQDKMSKGVKARI